MPRLKVAANETRKNAKEVAGQEVELDLAPHLPRTKLIRPPRPLKDTGQVEKRQGPIPPC